MKESTVDYRPPAAATSEEERLAPHFLRRELEVSGSFPHLARPIPAELLPNARRLAKEVLEPIRVAIGRPVKILSGYRSEELNRAVGGSPTSQHRRAEAADFFAEDVREVFDRLVGGKIPVACGQCILYPDRWFIHIAIPSAKYPGPVFQVHWPRRGLGYYRVRSVRELNELIGR